MTIYIDIVLIENIIMNYTILFGTGLIIKNNNKKIKMFWGSIIGASYSIIEYMGITSLYSTLFMKIALSCLMINISFNPQSVKEMLKILVLFYLVTFTTGGCAFGILNIINPNNISIKNSVIFITHPYMISIIAGTIGFIIIQYSFYYNKRRINIKDLKCTINIKICGKLYSLKALIDSGNTLKEPLTKAPVIVVEKDALKNLNNIIDKEIKNKQGGDSRIKISWIPFKSIGKNNGMLMGIKPEYIEVEYEKEKIIVNNVIIGIYNKKINKNYSALVGLNIFNGGNKNEYNVNSKKNIFQCS